MKEKEIVEYLKEKYSAEVVILHGSRVSGKNRVNSDWDLIVFTKKNIKGGPEEFNGDKLDLKIVTLPISKEEFVDHFGNPLANTIVLLDNENNLGNQIVEEFNKQYALGRKLTELEYSNRKNYLARVLDRMEGTIDKPELFFLHVGYFYEKAIQYWFETKGRFSKPIYEAIPEIKKEDSDYYKKLEMIFSDGVSNKEKVESAKWINSNLFESLPVNQIKNERSNHRKQSKR